MTEPVRIAPFPTMTGGVRHDVPVLPSEPGEMTFVIVNSGAAMFIKGSEQGYITTETLPLVDAVEQIETFIAKLRSSGAIEASAALKAARQASNVVALAPESLKAV